MTGPSPCPPGDAVADYWSSDLPAEAVAELEAHIFDCAACAAKAAAAGALAHGIAEIVRAGRVQAVVTDHVLNRLARDGVRIRSYVLEPGAVVPCAIWAEDDLVAVRLRADFSGYTSVSVVTTLEGGGVERVDEVPVHAGTREIVEVIPARHLRDLRQMAVRLALLGATGEGTADQPIAEYVLAHAGAFGRSGDPTDR